MMNADTMSATATASIGYFCFSFDFLFSQVPLEVKEVHLGFGVISGNRVGTVPGWKPPSWPMAMQ